jgi:hypothetical protein
MCYPCDNSVIRVQKNFVGARCFGSSLVTKDNFIFGIKESEASLRSKVALEDTLLNFETKKALTNRNCEFWMEFDDGSKLFAEMIS